MKIVFFKSLYFTLEYFNLVASFHLKCLFVLLLFISSSKTEAMYFPPTAISNAPYYLISR